MTILADTAAFADYATHAAGRAKAYWTFYWLAGATVCLTAFYMARAWMLVFGGRPRDLRLHARAREYPGLWGPMLAMAFLSVIAGYAMNIPELLRASIEETKIVCNDQLAATKVGAIAMKFTAFDQAWPLASAVVADPDAGEPAEPTTAPSSPAALAHQRGHALASGWPAWTCLVGIGLGISVYRRGYAYSRNILRSLADELGPPLAGK